MRDNVIVTAVITVDSCKALMQITTVQEAGEDLLFHRAGEVTTGFEFIIMTGDTLI